MGGHIIVVDRGPAFTRAVAFDARATAVASARMACRQFCPRPGRTMQVPADPVGAPVDRPTCGETASLGAALPAGRVAGSYAAPDVFVPRRRRDRRSVPTMADGVRRARRAGWLSAVGATLHHRGAAA